MSEIQTQNKRQYWQEQIEKWQLSNQSMSVFCRASGIKLSTFSYWRSILLPLENADRDTNIFKPIKIIKDKVIATESNKSIQIKLITGHVVYLLLCNHAHYQKVLWDKQFRIH